MIRVSDEILKGPSNVSDLHGRYIEVIKQVLPEKYEILYARLVSLIVEYKTITNKIELLNGSFDSSSINAERIRDYIDDLKKEILGLEIEDLNFAQKLNELSIDSPTDKRASIMRKRLTIIKNTLTKQERVTELSKIKEDYLQHMENTNSTSMPDLIQSLEQKISEIKEVQSQIESIKIDESDRLDHLEIMNKHLLDIQKIIDSDKRFKIMPEEERKQVFDTLATFMAKYFEFRVMTFKLAESTSSQIIESYDNRNMLPSNDSGIILVKADDLLAESWEIPEVIDGLLPFDSISIDLDAIRKMTNIAKGYDVMTNLSKKKMEGTYTLKDAKESIGEFSKLKFVAMSNKSGASYSAIFGLLENYLSNYEYFSKKEKMTL